jgi:non-haem Fe2+, alpha-ketoglutarate-dependent halogenase
MAGSLSKNEVEQYHQNGFLGPFPALSIDEVEQSRQALERFEAAEGATLGALPGQLRAKTHLLFPWLNRLVRHPAILDAVESLLGEDILLYHVTCWLKEPGDGAIVTWHQDGAYFNLDPPEHVTAWIALADATPQSGCMQVLPGSHRAGALEHVMGDTRNNLLSNGQRVPGVEGEGAVYLAAPSGHFTLHHTHILHASGPNQANFRRIGIGASYIPTAVRFNAPARVSATLVRGSDAYGHFDAEHSPSAEFDQQARLYHASTVENFFAAHGSKRTADES